MLPFGRMLVRNDLSIIVVLTLASVWTDPPPGDGRYTESLHSIRGQSLVNCGAIFRSSRPDSEGDSCRSQGLTGIVNNLCQRKRAYRNQIGFNGLFNVIPVRQQSPDVARVYYPLWPSGLFRKLGSSLPATLVRVMPTQSQLSARSLNPNPLQRAW